MDLKTFEKFRVLVYEKSGINLNESKVALVTARVGKRLRALGVETYEDYLDILINDESGEEVVNFLDVISTNVTHFFREAAHFVHLAEVYKQWLDQGQTRFRFWSAASSTGEEPYTIAMTLKDVSDSSKIDSRILATDISTRVLAACMKGEYDAEKVNNIPKQMLSKYFQPATLNGKPAYRVGSQLKNMIVFRRLNLSTPPFPMKGPLDAVFCRNVMIYFDNNIRKILLNEIYRLLKPGGFLYVGHAESLTGIVSNFKSVKPSVYVKQ